MNKLSEAVWAVLTALVAGAVLCVVILSASSCGGDEVPWEFAWETCYIFKSDCSDCDQRQCAEYIVNMCTLESMERFRDYTERPYRPDMCSPEGQADLDQIGCNFTRCQKPE